GRPPHGATVAGGVGDGQGDVTEMAKPANANPPMGDEPQVSERVGMVLGTDPASPLSFWVAVSPDAYLQLDDAVIVDTEVPGRGTVRIAGIVQDARARHEGASFDTDVFLIDRGVL